MTIFVRTVAFGLMTGVFSVALTFLTVGFKYGTLDEKLWVACLFVVAGIVGACIYRANPETAWDLFAVWRKVIPTPDTAKKILLLALGLGLVGCSTFADLKDVTLADAQQALTWAREDRDVLAVACNETIVDILQTATVPALHRDPVGVLSAGYLVRSTRRAVEGIGTSELRTKFLLGCAGLVADERDVLIKLGIKLAPLPIP